MKVAELEKGDMLFPVSGMRFLITSYTLSDNEPWVRVVETKRRHTFRHQGLRVHQSTKPEGSQFMIYLGTKKEVGGKAAWSNRFCLLDNRVVAVEPSCWKWIQKSD
jgi:hypothetical protein